jgi:hypothetical protein
MLLEKLTVNQIVKKFTAFISKPRVHCHVDKHPAVVAILIQTNSVHNFPSYFPKIHSNVILASTPKFFECLFHLGFATKVFFMYFHLLNTCYMSCPAHHP